jgi:rhodanese-related sulfurtransferase
MEMFNSEELRQHEDAFTIIDIRNDSEVKANKIFKNSIHIPLHELRERVNEIPVNKPLVVHCAGGYRSAAGSSLINAKLKGAPQVYDLSEAVKQFQK